MSKPRPDIDLCNRDCFNCEYPDCILDGVTASDYAASREFDRAAIFDRLDNKGQAIAAKQKAYREANRDEIAAKQKAYREANRDEIAAKQKAYREANRDEIAAKQKAYYEANRDEIAAKQKAIQVFRKQRGYSQRAFADRLGVSQALISLWESGSVPADWMAISAIFPELILRTEGPHV